MIDVQLPAHHIPFLAGADLLDAGGLTEFDASVAGYEMLPDVGDSAGYGSPAWI